MIDSAHSDFKNISTINVADTSMYNSEHPAKMKIYDEGNKKDLQGS